MPSFKESLGDFAYALPKSHFSQVNESLIIKTFYNKNLKSPISLHESIIWERENIINSHCTQMTKNQEARFVSLERELNMVNFKSLISHIRSRKLKEKTLKKKTWRRIVVWMVTMPKCLRVLHMHNKSQALTTTSTRPTGTCLSSSHLVSIMKVQ